MRWRGWAIAVVIGHVAGSYGVELFDALANYGMAVPFAERLDAPVRCLPLLVRWTWQSRRTLPAADLDLWWVAYAVPFAGVLAVAPLVSCAARRRRPPAAGFAPIMPATSDADRPVH